VLGFVTLDGMATAPGLCGERLHRLTRRLGSSRSILLTDYSSPAELEPSSASQHGRSTFSSGKSAFLGLGPIAVVANRRAKSYSRLRW
jgi:hypothetical protein